MASTPPLHHSTTPFPFPATNPSIHQSTNPLRPPPLTPAAAALLRPLLDDLVQEESYLEVRQATNQPGGLALAIRLDDQRAGLWQTNLAAALASLPGLHSTPATNGWLIQVQSPGNGPTGEGASRITDHASRITDHASRIIQMLLTRSGEWTVLALASNPPSALLAQLSSNLVSTINASPATGWGLASATRRLQPAPGRPAAEFWLEADVDVRRAAGALALGANWPKDLPALSLSVTGDGRNVVTSCRLDFPKPLDLDMEPWNIPTNLVHDPLDSFTAIRGFQPWLSSLKAWNDLHVGTPPNQLFCWAQPGAIPFMTYCAAPLPDASNRVWGVSERLLRDYNPWITNHTLGRLGWSPNYQGVGWLGVPFMAPFLRSVADGGTGFAFGGLFAYPLTNQPSPGLLFQEVTARTNLMYCDWEQSAPRVEEWVHIGQLWRLLFGKAALPPNSASMAWLDAARTNLAYSVTGVGETGPAQLTLTRVSTIGLTALEMHLLADWLESPRFPYGLNTFVGPQRPPPHPGTLPPGLKRQPRLAPVPRAGKGK